MLYRILRRRRINYKIDDIEHERAKSDTWSWWNKLCDWILKLWRQEAK
jgi:hypothetical protein